MSYIFHHNCLELLVIDLIISLTLVHNSSYFYRQSFLSSVQIYFYTTEYDTQLFCIWSTHPVTVYPKTESLKGLLLHYSQVKLALQISAPNVSCQWEIATLTTAMQIYSGKLKLFLNKILVSYFTSFATTSYPVNFALRTLNVPNHVSTTNPFYIYSIQEGSQNAFYMSITPPFWKWVLMSFFRFHLTAVRLNNY